MKEDYYYQKEEEEKVKAILFGVEWDANIDFEHSMDELKGLVRACDMEPVGILTQVLVHPVNSTYMGSGKVEELKQFAAETCAEVAVCEGDLTPSQMKNLQDILKMPVWDRTNLILEIFSRRAGTREAKLQVESAYLQFMLPRLTGMWQHLGRQSGGGGSRANKGEGEKQIELDRRIIGHRIQELNRELKEVTRIRQVQRDGRFKGKMPNVAMVGYTNAGKSSLMNRLLGDSGNRKEVFEKDMLFATLDTSIRKITLKDGREFLLSDTVGFIENLPHSLVKAFRSTLEEACHADLLLIVLDVSDPYYLTHKRVTEDTLKELGACDIPVIYVLNKTDLLPGGYAEIGTDNPDTVRVSVKTGAGMDKLEERILAFLDKDNAALKLLIPYSGGALVGRIHEEARISVEEYRNDGIYIECECPKALAGVLSQYEIS